MFNTSYKKLALLLTSKDTPFKICEVLVCIFCGAVIGLFVYKGTIAPVLLRGWGLFRGIDGCHYYFWLRSIVFDGDFDFRNEINDYNYLPDSVRNFLLSQPLTPSGLLPNKYPIGWAVLAFPAIVVGHLSALSLGLFGYNYALDGYSLPYQVAIVGLQLFYFLVGGLCFFRLLSQQSIFSSKTSIGLLSLLVWMSSPLLFYQTADITMIHGLVFSFLCLLCFETSQLEALHEDRFKPTFFMGVIAGLMVITRPQSCVYLLYPVACLFVNSSKHYCSGQKQQNFQLGFIARKLFDRETILTLLWFLFPVIILAVTQFVCHSIVNGGKGIYSYRGETFDFLSPHIWQVLFSPFHGIFYWNTLLFLGVVGFVVRLITRPSLMLRCLAISGCLNIYINGAWHCWWFGASLVNAVWKGS